MSTAGDSIGNAMQYGQLAFSATGNPLFAAGAATVGAAKGVLDNQDSDNLQSGKNMIRSSGSPQVTASYINPAQQKVQSETNQRLAEIRRGGITGMTANKLQQAYRNASLGKQAAQVGAAQQAFDQQQANIKTGLNLIEGDANRKAQLAGGPAGAQKLMNQQENLKAATDWWAKKEGRETVFGLNEAAATAEGTG